MIAISTRRPALQPHRAPTRPAHRASQDGCTPVFRRNVPTSVFSCGNDEDTTIRDQAQGLTVVNFIATHYSSYDMFVLRDARDRRRVCMEFQSNAAQKSITIHSVQRLRTCYIPTGHGDVRWCPHEEDRAARWFRSDLGGIHPSEFLLSEFVFQHAHFIRSRWSVFLRIPANNPRPGIYGPLRDRFFHARPHTLDLYALDLQKRRVRDALTLA